MAIYVKVKDNKIEFALRKFKRKVKDSGLLKELQDRSFYKKPSAIKKEERSKALARIRQRTKKAEL
tara:strand:- start:554 stop:751 length:198 start_codon:yes stop_codon:yes gene_type:complete